MWHHGGDILSINQSSGEKKLIDFSANINPLGQPKSIQDAISQSAKASLNYPDPFCRELKKSISKFENVNQDQIVCGNGAAEIIFKIAYSLKPKSVLIPAPTFAEYEQAVRQVGAAVDYLHLDEKKNFCLDQKIHLQLVGKDMVFICNPNNPVGNVADVALIMDVVERCKRAGIIVVIDECFMDILIKPQSMSKFISDFDNLIIIKAFTKSFAIPGVRLGYCLCANKKIVDSLEKTGPPWNVSTVAQLAGIAACNETDFLRESVAYIDGENDYLSGALNDLGMYVFDSKANFILFKSCDFDLRNKLISKGFVIRDCSNYVGLSDGFYRVAVRLHHENVALIKAIEDVL